MSQDPAPIQPPVFVQTLICSDGAELIDKAGRVVATTSSIADACTIRDAINTAFFNRHTPPSTENVMEPQRCIRCDCIIPTHRVNSRVVNRDGRRRQQTSALCECGHGQKVYQGQPGDPVYRSFDLMTEAEKAEAQKHIDRLVADRQLEEVA